MNKNSFLKMNFVFNKMEIHCELIFDFIYPYYDNDFLIWSLVCKTWHRKLSVLTDKKTYRKTVMYDFTFFKWSQVAVDKSNICKHLCEAGLLPQLQYALAVNNCFMSKDLGCIAAEKLNIAVYRWLQDKYELNCDHCLYIMLVRNETEIYAEYVNFATTGDLIHIIYKNNISLFSQLLIDNKILFNRHWAMQLFMNQYFLEFLEIIVCFKKLTLSDELELAYGAVECENKKGLEWLFERKMAWDRRLLNYASRESRFMDICVWIQKKGWY